MGLPSVKSSGVARGKQGQMPRPPFFARQALLEARFDLTCYTYFIPDDKISIMRVAYGKSFVR